MAFTEADYNSLRKQCMLWAEAADTQDAFEAFLALAETWKRINEFDQSVPELESHHLVSGGSAA